VQNIVAPQGTAFTDQHARILKRYVNEAVLCFDSDNAGQNAAVRSLDHLLASGMAVRVAVAPAPHDPDSFIKAFGGEKFRELINNAKGFFDYYLERLCQQNDAHSDKGRLTILRAMAETVHKTGSAVLIDTYAQKTALRLGVSPEAVRAEFAKASRPAAVTHDEEMDEPSFETTPQVIERPSIQEFWLLKLLLLHDTLVDWTAQHVDLNWVLHPIVRQIVGMRLDAKKSGSWTNLAAFLDGCDSTEMRSLVTEAAAEERAIPNAEKQLADVILKLRNQFLDRQIAAVTQKAGLPEIPDAEKIQLLHEQKKLREQKKAQLTAASDA
jgi:DNA primase